jgi:hypothetical protein
MVKDKKMKSRKVSIMYDGKHLCTTHTSPKYPSLKACKAHFISTGMKYYSAPINILKKSEERAGRTFDESKLKLVYDN